MNTTFEYMQKALDVAKQSDKDIPIGAVIVCDGEIIASAHNEKEAKNNPLLHAEMLVIERACEYLQSWRLDSCELYVTLEPCPMCAWAIIQARIKKVVFGAYDPLYGALGSVLDLRHQSNSKLIVTGGILEDKCAKMISEYMSAVRGVK